jgi:lysine 2,3-aminomutase
MCFASIKYFEGLCPSRPGLGRAINASGRNEMAREALISDEEKPPAPSVLEYGLGQETQVFGGESAVGRIWPGVGREQWNDWRWQLANRLRTLEELSLLLGLAPEAAARYGALTGLFHYSVTPYYLSLIDWSDPEDPVRKQCIPDLREMDFHLVGDEDPLEEEEDMQVPGLVHRYPDRVLAVVTGACSVYCRHCTRKRIWHEGEFTRSRGELAAMAEYVRRTPEVREVVVSGGDPLLMNAGLLDWFLGELQAIPHVEVLRIGTRVPVVLPMRVTEDLARMLRSHRPLWLNTQFNHPREVTQEAAAACDRLLSAGIPVSNQSVLLRGINDSVEVMKSLCQALQRIMVRPYYLFQCDPVKGVEHLRTSVWKGVEIIERLRGHTGGLCIPSFVVDAPGGGGKIPLQPNYLLSASDREVLLRNYEGMIIRYFNPQEADAVKPSNGNGKGKRPDKGGGKVLAPDAAPRYRRRKQKEGVLRTREARG